MVNVNPKVFRARRVTKGKLITADIINEYLNFRDVGASQRQAASSVGISRSSATRIEGGYHHLQLYYKSYYIPVK